jgi:hypothetical protein
MTDLNGATPILGAKPRLGVNYITVLVRHLGQDGTYEAAGVRQLPDGNLLALTDRSQYLSATDLLDEIRTIVREELAAARKPATLQRVENLVTYRDRPVQLTDVTAALDAYFAGKAEDGR